MVGTCSSVNRMCTPTMPRIETLSPAQKFEQRVQPPMFANPSTSVSSLYCAPLCLFGLWRPVKIVNKSLHAPFPGLSYLLHAGEASPSSILCFSFGLVAMMLTFHGGAAGPRRCMRPPPPAPPPPPGF